MIIIHNLESRKEKTCINNLRIGDSFLFMGAVYILVGPESGFNLKNNNSVLFSGSEEIEIVDLEITIIRGV